MADRRDLTVAMATYDDLDGVFFTVTSRAGAPPGRGGPPPVPGARQPSRRTGGADDRRLLRHPTGRSATCRSRSSPAPQPATRCSPRRRRTGCSSWTATCSCCPAPSPRCVPTSTPAPDAADLIQGPLCDGGGAPLRHAFRRRVGWRHARPLGDDRAPNRRSTVTPSRSRRRASGCSPAGGDRWPGLHPHLRGFGGEERYVHEQIRRAGGRALCLPGLRWAHRFERTSIPLPEQRGRPPAELRDRPAPAGPARRRRPCPLHRVDRIGVRRGSTGSWTTSTGSWCRAWVCWDLCTARRPPSSRPSTSSSPSTSPGSTAIFVCGSSPMTPASGTPPPVRPAGCGRSWVEPGASVGHRSSPSPTSPPASPTT